MRLGEQFRRLKRWLHSHSIRVRLYSVFALLFLLVIGLGIVGFARLSDVNHASEVIRNHWLRDTRILGDSEQLHVRLPHGRGDALVVLDACRVRREREGN